MTKHGRKLLFHSEMQARYGFFLRPLHTDKGVGPIQGYSRLTLLESEFTVISR
jgi:hypothetical protein